MIVDGGQGGWAAKQFHKELLKTDEPGGVARKKDVRRWGTHLSWAGEFWSSRN